MRAVFNEHITVMTEKISKLDGVAEFLRYFEHDWLPKKLYWVYFHRAGLGINTNMFVEAFHRVFKYNYLSGKHKKQVVACLLQLVKFARDLAFKQAIRLLKRRDCYRLKEIRKRHGQSLEMSLEGITDIDENAWNVKSENSDSTYHVSCVSKSCKYENCQERCIECNVCVHQFTCSCADTLIRHTICKHIHLINRQLLKNEKETKNDEVIKDDSTFNRSINHTVDIIADPNPSPRDLNIDRSRLENVLISEGLY